jgi:methionine biosynthesis protein MetW
MDTLATLYEEIWRRQRQQGMTSADRLLAGADLVPPSRTLLDVGCGDGALSPLVRGKVAEVHGIEWAEHAIEEARALGVRVRKCDLNRDSLSYPDESFDAVTCLDVIEHVLDPRRLLREIHRVLRPAGALILITPNIRYVHFVSQLLFKGRFPRTSSDPEGYDGGHIHYFTYGDCEALLAEANFKSVEAYGLYRWALLTKWGKIKEAIKGLLGERFKREFFSSAVVIQAKRP